MAHKCLISKTANKKSLFLFDLERDIVYSTALFNEWGSMEVLNAFIYADVNTHYPIITADRKGEMCREEWNAATHGDVRASCTTTTSK